MLGGLSQARIQADFPGHDFSETGPVVEFASEAAESAHVRQQRVCEAGKAKAGASTRSETFPSMPTWGVG